jgi:hypothetical protein
MNAGILEIARWTRGPTLFIERRDSGLTIRTRPPVLQLALTSLLCGLLAVGVVRAPALRIGLGIAIAAGAFLFMYASARRRGATLLQFLATDPREEESPS